MHHDVDVEDSALMQRRIIMRVCMLIVRPQLDNKVWTVDGHEANITDVGGMSVFFKRTSRGTQILLTCCDTQTEWDFGLTTITNHNICSHKSANHPRSEKVLSTSCEVCSRVNRCFILKLPCENYIVADCSICVRRCRWISVLFMYCNDAVCIL